jgi:hypothetical protein
MLERHIQAIALAFPNEPRWSLISISGNYNVPGNHYQSVRTGLCKDIYLPILYRYNTVGVQKSVKSSKNKTVGRLLKDFRK